MYVWLKKINSDTHMLSNYMAEADFAIYIVKNTDFWYFCDNGKLLTRTLLSQGYRRTKNVLTLKRSVEEAMTSLFPTMWTFLNIYSIWLHRLKLRKKTSNTRLSFSLTYSIDMSGVLK